MTAYCSFFYRPETPCIISSACINSNYDHSDHEDFYEKLQATIQNVKSHEVYKVLGDFSTKIGVSRDLDYADEPYGLGVWNDNGNRLSEFCKMSD